MSKPNVTQLKATQKQLCWVRHLEPTPPHHPHTSVTSRPARKLKFWKDSRDQRESQKNLNLDNFSQISSNLGLDNLWNCSLGRVSISTIFKSESRADLDLNNLENISLVQISISTIFKLIILELRFCKRYLKLCPLLRILAGVSQDISPLQQRQAESKALAQRWTLKWQTILYGSLGPGCKILKSMPIRPVSS